MEERETGHQGRSEEPKRKTGDRQEESETAKVFRTKQLWIDISSAETF